MASSLALHKQVGYIDANVVLSKQQTSDLQIRGRPYIFRMMSEPHDGEPLEQRGY
ncbi:hypothetical protein [Burkholderia vietnamiensis]|uniref:hypothetical protein n=1 Tax=Burkholderia vietnamiensis TaxID=60552 RepID=UPI000ADBD51A|nr:hypothetical protein [Burkholderia vietnamiensis]